MADHDAVHHVAVTHVPAHRVAVHRVAAVPIRWAADNDRGSEPAEFPQTPDRILGESMTAQDG